MCWMWPMRGRISLTTRFALFALTTPLVGGGLIACQASHPPGADSRTQTENQLTNLSALGEIRRNPASGIISYAKGDDLAGALASDPSYRQARERHDVADMTLQFLSAYRDEFLIADPPSEFRIGPVAADVLGFRRVRLRQVFNGLLVVGAELSLQFNDDLALTLLQGRYIPTPQVAPEDAELSAIDAVAIAADELGKNLHLSEPELIIYPSANGRGVLAYQLIATQGLTDRQRITIDAGTGETLAKESLRYP